MKVLISIIIGLLVIGGGMLLIGQAGNDSQNDQQMPRSESSELPSEDEDELPAHVQSADIREIVDATGQDEVEVEMGDSFFSHTVLTVSKGTTVTWTNTGNLSHNVVSTDDSPQGGLNSELLANGENYSFTFDEVGTYNYICTPHPNSMRAIVEVIE